MPSWSRTGNEPFTLATAMPKGDRLDWLVQKTVELGVDRIVLLHTERSTVRWKAERAEKQLVRLRRIADESTRQSRRVWRTADRRTGGCRRRAPTRCGRRTWCHGVIDGESMIAIGPEGGWTDDELARSPRRIGLGDKCPACGDRCRRRDHAPTDQVTVRGGLPVTRPCRFVSHSLCWQSHATTGGQSGRTTS